MIEARRRLILQQHRPGANLPAIILAAGRSSRMGSPKQLLRVSETHLLGIAIETAQTICSPIHVVLGCFAEMIEPKLSSFQVRIVLNGHWQEGMSSSLRCGLDSALAVEPECERVLVMLCDQPLIGPSHLLQLSEACHRETQAVAVASEYNDVIGVPAIFRRPLFPELQTLSGARGAGNVLRCRSQQIIEIKLPPECAADIDTPEDFEIFKHSGRS